MDSFIYQFENILFFINLGRPSKTYDSQMDLYPRLLREKTEGCRPLILYLSEHLKGQVFFFFDFLYHCSKQVLFYSPFPVFTIPVSVMVFTHTITDTFIFNEIQPIGYYMYRLSRFLQLNRTFFYSSLGVSLQIISDKNVPDPDVRVLCSLRPNVSFCCFD